MEKLISVSILVLKKFDQGANWTGAVIVIGAGLVVTLFAVVISQIVEDMAQFFFLTESFSL